MDAERRAGARERLVQVHACEHLLAHAPRAPQTPERWPVAEAARPQPLVDLLHRDRLGVRRPGPSAQLLERRIGVLRQRPQGAAGVANPGGAGVVLVVGLREHAERAPARAALAVHAQLHQHRPLLRQRDGELHGQLLDQLASDVAPGTECQLEDRSWRQERLAADRVVGQPRVRGRRKTPGEQVLVRSRNPQRAAEQRVIERPQPGSGDVCTGGRGRPEVPLVLERVRR